MDVSEIASYSKAGVPSLVIFGDRIVSLLNIMDAKGFFGKFARSWSNPQKTKNLQSQSRITHAKGRRSIQMTSRPIYGLGDDTKIPSWNFRNPDSKCVQIEHKDPQ